MLNDLIQISQELRINYIELLQSTQSEEDKTDEVEISDLYKEIKSLKTQLFEIKEHLYSNRGGKYFESIFSKVLNFGKGF